jgi:hypothetical protein
MKANKILTGILMSLMIATPVLAVNNTVNGAVEKTSKQAVSKQVKKQNDLLEAVDQKVLNAFKDVQKAVQYLQKDGQEKQALAALEKAVGQFDTITAARPELSLVPIQSNVEVTELATSPAMIKRNTELAIDLLKDNKVVAARALLQPMQDDMISTSVYLPMATYPDAIKQATKALVDGNKEESLDIIATALSTFVVKESIIPLGLVRAQERLKVAAKLDKEKDKDKIKTLLEAANDDLEVAKLLGYTDKEGLAYENIAEQIKAIRKEVEGKNVVEKMYEKIASSFKKLLNKEAQQKAKIAQ